MEESLEEICHYEDGATRTEMLWSTLRSNSACLADEANRAAQKTSFVFLRSTGLNWSTIQGIPGQGLPPSRLLPSSRALHSSISSPPAANILRCLLVAFCVPYFFLLPIRTKAEVNFSGSGLIFDLDPQPLDGPRCAFRQDLELFELSESRYCVWFDRMYLFFSHTWPSATVNRYNSSTITNSLIFLCYSVIYRKA